MDLKIRWSPKAVVHLQEICNFIRKDSDRYASLFAKKILMTIECLPQFPKSGRIVPEYQAENIREKICGNYRIVYRLKGELIEIAAICHGARPLKIA